MPSNIVCLITTPPEQAEAIAQTIVENRLAACVSIIPAVRSIYWWEGIRNETESQLVVKTTKQAEQPLNELLAKIHPYETFELIVINIDSGNTRYLDWITASTEKTQ